MKLIYVVIFSLVLSACSLFPSNKDESDIYANVDSTDVLNDKPVTLTKRVSHIVTFDFDSYDLPFNAAEVVEPHVRYLIANPKLKVALQGNASNEGSREYNYQLAHKRVDSVKGLFIELGIEPDQIIELSVGETQSSFIPQRSVLLVY